MQRGFAPAATKRRTHAYLPLNELVRDLRERDIRTKSRLLSTGATRGGIPFGRGALYYLLSNHFYIGEVKYKGI